MPTAPKVFISHASEDKERFVLRFAQRLRESGVDVWLDQWEMRPGDSLVDKIFEQGLKQAQAVIVVISAASVHKPWVQEELNVSVVKRIEQGLKLIPVVIDHCEVPASVQATVWQRIDDLDHYDDAFQRILSAIFNTAAAPPLGKRPARYEAPEPVLPGLTAMDERILRGIAQHEVEQQEGALLFEQLLEQPDMAGVSEDEALESVDILARNGFIHVEPLGPSRGWLSLTLPGFQQFAAAFVPGYAESVARISGLLINENVADNRELAQRTGEPLAFVNFVLDGLAEDGHIVMGKYGSGQWEIVQIAPSLRRTLR